jgi:photolyase PhrII
MSPLSDRLPSAIRERVTVRDDRPLTVEGRDVVLYWMRTAVRGHENPALDAALAASAELGLPVLVYHGVSERYPYASDRLHAFILQGAQDVAVELAERGVAYALHVEREGHRGPHLRDLARRAALVVTEDMPVPPLVDWTRDLARSIDVPLWTVDTACVVPMSSVGRRPERAFAFRDATRRIRDARIAQPWTEAQVSRPAPDLASLGLPFEPVDTGAMDLDELLSACDIDHAVAPVHDTPGGSVAGYARFEQFLGRLRGYAKRRNDPLVDGVSRMSAYLHFGHVSPLRVARRVASIGGAGADKYLDELLVWRELAHAWCWHTADVHAADEAIPGWARQTLADHARDPRAELLDLETLARGRTGDALWDAAQRSLLRHGELHNNLRMTWGKALLGWTPDLEAAMERLADLNHRYALDGRDPSSYGGLWWCLGLFDRPFTPEQPVFGKVRERTTAVHAKRLDVERYASRVGRPIAPRLPRVLVIGAGLSGLACARALTDHGLEVVVVDKGRAAGGRMSTRRADAALRFDHGAQFFTARGESFRRHVGAWEERGVVARWEARFVTLERGELGPDPGNDARYVGTPSMSAVARHVASDLAVRSGTRVAELMRGADGRWIARDVDGNDIGSGFDLVVCALPAAQAAELLDRPAPALAQRARGVEIAPCIAAMVAFERPLDVAFDAAFVGGSAELSWLARDASKPGRDAACDSWVVHAGPEWSARCIEHEPAKLLEPLLDAFAVAVGRELPATVYDAVHRWRYALPTRPLDDRSVFDADLGLGLCGDWCGGPRVEGAWRSGTDLAGRILRRATLAPAAAPASSS